MPNLILDYIAAFLPVIITAAAVTLYLREYSLRRKAIKALSAASIQVAEEKSESIIHQALKKAQKILGRAELESAEVIADSKLLTKKLEAQYGEQLTKQVEAAQKEFSNYLEELKTRGEQSNLLTQEFTKQRVNEIFEQFETNLATFLTSTEQKSVAAIELELKAARSLIDTYKTQQLQMIDENIISMLEKTLSIVLSKRLTLRDHTDLVYEALEKAKIEKFVA